MSRQSLEDLLKTVGNPVNMLRNSQVGAYVYPVVPAEYSNWRDEQRAWQRFLRAVRPVAPHGRAYSSRARMPSSCSRIWPPTASRTSRWIEPSSSFPAAYDGYVIGDGILFHLAENSLLFVGRAPSANWIQFHAETGGFNVTTSKDDRSPGRTRGKAVIRKLLPLPDSGAEGLEADREAEWRTDS